MWFPKSVYESPEKDGKQDTYRQLQNNPNRNAPFKGEDAVQKNIHHPENLPADGEEKKGEVKNGSVGFGIELPGSFPDNKGNESDREDNAISQGDSEKQGLTFKHTPAEVEG